MNKLKQSLFSILFLCLTLTVVAQKKQIQIADRYYEDFFFLEAIEKYEDALKISTNKKSQEYILGQIAKCYQYSFQYTAAEEYYNKLIQLQEKPKAETILEYAIMLKFNGKYKEAKEQFKMYQKMTENTDPYGSFHMRSINWAIQNDTVNRQVFISRTNLDLSGQSLGYSLFNKGIVYAHARNKKPYYSMQLYDLDYAILDDSIRFSDGEVILDSINFESNESSPYIDASNNVMYFSANAAKVQKGTVSKKASEANKDGVMNIKIYKAKWNGEQFGRVEELPFNNVEYNCTHPCISSNGNILYFVSDMPGGIGGLDIYMSKKDKNGNWGKPMNMGRSINTEENDMFPFVFKEKLYFASKGHNGFGGYDIYAADILPTGMCSGVKNLGRPYNSFRDDIAFILNKDGRTGYLSSNRGNDDGDDEVFYFRQYNTPLTKELVEKMNELNELMFQEVVQKRILAADGIPIRVKTAIQPSDSATTIAKNKLLPDTTIATAEPVKSEEPTKVAIPVVAPVVAVIAPVDSAIASNKPKTKTKKVKSNNTTVAKNNTDKNVPTPMVEKPIALTPPKPEVDSRIADITDTDERESLDDELLKRVFSNVNFAFNSSAIAPEMLYILDSAAQVIRRGSKLKISIRAHTDSRGSNVYNKNLSMKRAIEVRNYLLKKGVPGSRISARGFGEEELLNECNDGTECTEDQHSANRRVELKLTR